MPIFGAAVEQNFYDMTIGTAGAARGFFSIIEVAMNKRTKYLHYVCTEGMQCGAGSIPVDEVIYFRSDNASTVVVTATGEHRISTPLAELLILLDPEKFWQVQRFTVVNRARIETIRREDQEHLVMKFKGRDECMTVGDPYCRQFQYGRVAG